MHAVYRVYRVLGGIKTKLSLDIELQKGGWILRQEGMLKTVHDDILALHVSCSLAWISLDLGPGTRSFDHLFQSKQLFGRIIALQSGRFIRPR